MPKYNVSERYNGLTVVLDTERAKTNWPSDDDGTLYLSSKDKYYTVKNERVRLLSKEQAAAWLMLHNQELPDDLKEAGESILE